MLLNFLHKVLAFQAVSKHDGTVQIMNQAVLLERYHQLRELAEDADTWLESEIGSDLWVDGINVFLTVSPEDFIEGLERFESSYGFKSHEIVNTILQFQRYCREASADGEFPLYQALAVGMTWLSLQPQINGSYFNLPVQITNHSIALLLSPTYLAVWAHSYNEGIGLYLDLHSTLPTLFRPEHGRIYQNAGSYLEGTHIKFPFQNYFHEIAHILFFHDVYQRVLGSEDECRSYWTHIEACIYGLEEQVLAEMMEVQPDLHAIDDGFGSSKGFEDFISYRFGILGAQENHSIPKDTVRTYIKRNMQLGEANENIPDNEVKAKILASHKLDEERLEELDTHCKAFATALQVHSLWGIKSYRRNSIPAFREVVELLSPDAYCMQKLEESMRPDSWGTLEDLLSKNPFDEICSQTREKNIHVWNWRDTLSRLAEMRGYLANANEPGYGETNQELFQIANRLARVIHEEKQKEGPAEQHESQYADMKREISEALNRLPNVEVRDHLHNLLSKPYYFVLEPN
ncbi:hypothetical protein HP401_03955 [Brevibacillus sp. HB2.2]|nr:hypothetical protein [Brevibacillus sp. HB2.2]